MKYVLQPAQRERLENWHYHAPKPDMPERFNAINDATRDVAKLIMECTPTSREQALALTKLEEARMWANSAIALNE